MKSPPKNITREIVFSGNGFWLRYPDERKYLKQWCHSWDGKVGEICLKVGEASKSLQQMRFVRGPLYEAIKDATGHDFRQIWIMPIDWQKVDDAMMR